MAASFLLQNKTLRLLAVVLGVLTLLGGLKMLHPAEELRLAKVDETVAGSDLQVILQGEAQADVEVQLTSVNGLAKTYLVELDEKGQGTLTLPGNEFQSAGTYALEAGYEKKRNSFTAAQSFEVVAAEPDLAQSRIHFSSSVLSSRQSTLMNVLLKDAYGNPVMGHALYATADSPSVQVFSSEFVTNEKGQMNFSVLGSSEGIAQIQLFDSTLGQPILGPAQVAAEGLLLEPSVQLAESGPVDAFVILGLDDESLTGDSLSVTVKAIDEEGFTVTDYTGSIRFSSSDEQADLPNDYTFLAEDQGEHSFSLGVKFVTLGEQTLSVTDLDNVRVNGEASTEVLNEEDASVDYNPDFETTDFAREGDFELISPASGSYSSGTLEIQGEAEYGHHAFIFVNEEEAGEADIEFDNSFAYTLQNLEDGNYEIYVEIRDEEGALVERSSNESVRIDSTAPQLVSLSMDPENGVEPEGNVKVVVLSEADLEEASVIFEGEVYGMEESSSPGKYEVLLVAPSMEGEYSIDVLLADALGNEVQYRDEALLKVSLEEEPVEDEEPVQEPALEKMVNSVTNLSATGGPGLVALSWETPESTLPLAYYRVYYGPSPAALFAVSETTDSSTHWTISDLLSNELYYFTVTAVDVEGNESEAGEAVLGVPEMKEGASAPSSTVPTYPVSTTLDQDVDRTPETGPAMNALVLLSTLGALGYVMLRRRARA
ncbi:fibronectin type III domain-containing protein [Candidatus Peregrinibacteria bacterium]|nr:MAG: fibronectin type III domain-containing protein [Candidatus Peregrinibacteria bacterium]